MGLSIQVSIITIFLNGERFLVEAIESVLAQTFQDWELLLVNDGSTDSSGALAKDYMRRYPGRMRYFEHDEGRNLGKSSSRNLGLRNANGRYIVFLDADDVLIADKLERQVAILESHRQAAMVYGRTEYWHSWTGNPKDVKHDTISKLGIQPGRLFSPPLLMTLFLQNAGLVPCLCALLARRDVIEEFGGFDESIQHLYEDQVLIAKMCMTTHVFVEDGIGERYRQHPGSSSAVAIRSREYSPRLPNQARLKFLNWLSSYLEDEKIGDRRLNRALLSELRPYTYRRLYFWLRLPAYVTGMIKDFLRGRESERESVWH